MDKKAKKSKYRLEKWVKFVLHLEMNEKGNTENMLEEPVQHKYLFTDEAEPAE